MDQSVYGVDDTDYQEDEDHDDYVDFDELPNYLSDHEDVLDDAEEFEGWDMNRPSQTEATFGSKETAHMVNKDVNENVANEIKPDPNMVWYGTNFDRLLAEDPVNARILELVVENAIDPNIILYTKVNLIKLAAINKAKASNLEDAELASMMTAVSLAQRDEKATRETENNEERIMRDCIDQMHWLSKTSHLQDRVNATLKKLIKSSRYQLPKTINGRNTDDLCGTLYALVSDEYYKTVPIAAEIDTSPQADHSSNTASHLQLQDQPHKHVPNAGIRFGTNIITHLTLVGGLPMHAKKLYTTDKATFKNFMGKVTEVSKSSQTSHHHRLGVLTQQQMEHGSWLCQSAEDMERLDLERISWQVVNETSFKAFPYIKAMQVFLIHVSLTIIFCSSLFHSLVHRYL